MDSSRLPQGMLPALLSVALGAFDTTATPPRRPPPGGRDSARRAQRWRTPTSRSDEVGRPASWSRDARPLRRAPAQVRPPERTKPTVASSDGAALRFERHLLLTLCRSSAETSGPGSPDYRRAPAPVRQPWSPALRQER